jgi:hypothetical protein
MKNWYTLGWTILHTSSFFTISCFGKRIKLQFRKNSIFRTLIMAVRIFIKHIVTIFRQFWVKGCISRSLGHILDQTSISHVSKNCIHRFEATDIPVEKYMLILKMAETAAHCYARACQKCIINKQIQCTWCVSHILNWMHVLD